MLQASHSLEVSDLRRLLLPLSGLALFLAGCATVAPMDSTDAPIRYSCKAGKRFTAAYALHGKRVVVTAGGATKTLKLARSASGARYTAGDAEIWSKGADAMLKGFPGGPYQDCRSQ
ncbi:MliC family protein [Caulobacter sp.]|jgi:membrane-bound inhibitor of C-type lysozyme|uniref:MliC family protein n=1 Tax=Caulobacter sp. TaxID=78 RepID=UPI0031E31BDF